ncbi:MAG: hypothetical protein QOG62_2221 [Thermoleophilaceae bacterium]|jgi:hypothetical protein|nr:hypothetical protein [Thermoleophilaceae bacterium]
MQITDYIQQIGAYAGFAAVIGLAVLAALYFSQAREVRRLREEGFAEAGSTAPPPPGQAAQRLQTQRPGAAPVAATAATAVQAPLAPGQKPPVQPPPPSTQVPAPGAQTPAARPPVPRPPVRPPARQPAGPQRMREPQSQPWYQAIQPRFLVLIVAGIVIVGGALIVGISSLGGSSPKDVPFGIVTEGTGAAKPDKSATSTSTEAAPLDPAQITVAVLNGTSVPGLAASIGDTVKAAGFKLGNIDNAPTQAANESAVLYAAGNEPAAQAVAKELDIAQVGQIDAGTQTQAGNAQVVVVVGPDQAP